MSFVGRLSFYIHFAVSTLHYIEPTVYSHVLSIQYNYGKNSDIMVTEKEMKYACVWASKTNPNPSHQITYHSPCTQLCHMTRKLKTSNSSLKNSWAAYGPGNSNRLEIIVIHETNTSNDSSLMK